MSQASFQDERQEAVQDRHPPDSVVSQVLNMSAMHLFCRKGDDQRKECGEILASELLWLESEATQDGPYFSGKQFTAVDIALLPWFIRLYILKHYRGFEMPKVCKKLVAWYALYSSWPGQVICFVCAPAMTEYLIKVRAAEP